MLERLMALVQEVELAETKMALLNTISIIVERLEHNVCAKFGLFAHQLMSPDYTLRQQHRRPTTAAMGTVRR
jgi:hypothetical protein